MRSRWASTRLWCAKTRCGASPAIPRGCRRASVPRRSTRSWRRCAGCTRQRDRAVAIDLRPGIEPAAADEIFLTDVHHVEHQRVVAPLVVLVDVRVLA